MGYGRSLLRDKEQPEEFTDENAKREFEISGLCTKCQNEIFK